MNFVNKSYFKIPVYVILTLAGFYFIENLLNNILENFYFSYIILIAYIIALSLFFTDYKFQNVFTKIGLIYNKSSIIETSKYKSLAILLMFILTISSIILGGKIQFNTIFINLLQFHILVLISQSIIEEIIFRGVILKSIMEDYNIISGIIISSVLFTAVHSFNPNISIISFINIFLAGIILSQIYIKTKSLLPAIGFHLSWNFTQSIILGVPVSGYHNSNSIFISTLPQSEIGKLMVGDNFGYESGLISVILLLIIVIYLNRFLNQK